MASDITYPSISPDVIQPPYVIGNYVWADRYSFGNGVVQAVGTIRLNAIQIRRQVTISDLCVRITTLAAAGNIQLALYGANTATGRPTGAALASTGSITTGAAALVSADITGPDVTLSPGLYWFAVNSDNATVILQAGGGAAVASDSSMIGSATLANISNAANNGALSLTTPQTFGTWPSLTSATFTEVPGTNNTAFGFKVTG